MGRHGPGRQVHPTVRKWDAFPEVLPVSGTLLSAPPTEGLLRHPYENHPHLEGHGLGFCSVGHQADPAEDTNKDIDGTLEPPQVPRSDEDIICTKPAHTPSRCHPKPVTNGVFALHCK